MLGTVARYGVGHWARSIHPAWLPYATLLVNVLGCLLIGWLYKWSLDRGLTGSWWEVALRVGFLGGLTTFSSFGLEVMQAWPSRPWLSIALAAGHLLFGLGAVVLGMNLASK